MDIASYSASRVVEQNDWRSLLGEQPDSTLYEVKAPRSHHAPVQWKPPEADEHSESSNHSNDAKEEKSGVPSPSNHSQNDESKKKNKKKKVSFADWFSVDDYPDQKNGKELDKDKDKEIKSDKENKDGKPKYQRRQEYHFNSVREAGRWAWQTGYTSLSTDVKIGEHGYCTSINKDRNSYYILFHGYSKDMGGIGSYYYYPDSDTYIHLP